MELNVQFNEPEYVVCTDLFYADDTMLIGSDVGRLRKHLDILVDEGRRYGLELNWGKTSAICVHHDVVLFQPSGKRVENVDQAVRLGGLLPGTGETRRELTRPLGEAKGAFKALETFWSHAHITRHSKVEIYVACIHSNILYDLESVWLLQGDPSRLDAFHVKSLRRIFNFQCSSFSQISNATVLELSGQPRLSEVLVERQLRH